MFFNCLLRIVAGAWSSMADWFPWYGGLKIIVLTPQLQRRLGPISLPCLQGWCWTVSFFFERRPTISRYDDSRRKVCTITLIIGAGLLNDWNHDKGTWSVCPSPKCSAIGPSAIGRAPENMSKSTLAAADRAAPVMTHCTTCSCDPLERLFAQAFHHGLR
jgi:hypothetical protein